MLTAVNVMAPRDSGRWHLLPDQSGSCPGPHSGAYSV